MAIPEGRGQQGPETDPKDRARARRLDKVVNDVLGSDAFYDLLEEVGTDEMAMAELKANPRAHLKRKGISIPEEVEVEVTGEATCIKVCSGWWIWKKCVTICCE